MAKQIRDLADNEMIIYGYYVGKKMRIMGYRTNKKSGGFSWPVKTIKGLHKYFNKSFVVVEKHDHEVDLSQITVGATTATQFRLLQIVKEVAA